MDTTTQYRLMCIKVEEIQKEWKPTIGDYMVSKAKYCFDDNCSFDNLCINCLGKDNIYVISGQYNYVEFVGGTHWFYGGAACVSGEGCTCNDTYCFTMTESGKSTIQNEFYTSSKNKHLWLPRQDQLQSIMNIYEDIKDLSSDFNYWFSNFYETTENLISMEQLWLGYVMFEKYNKVWDGTEWIS